MSVNYFYASISGLEKATYKRDSLEDGHDDKRYDSRIVISTTDEVHIALLISDLAQAQAVRAAAQAAIDDFCAEILGDDQRP